MSSDAKIEGIDHVLDLLSKPLSRYILLVLAGVDPVAFKGPLEIQEEKDEKDH